MRIHVGNIGARCPGCGCEDFQPAEEAAREFACLRCGARTTHGELLSQIAEETVRQVDRFLERLKRARETNLRRRR